MLLFALALATVQMTTAPDVQSASLVAAIDGDVARLTDSNVLLTASDFPAAKLARCQPLQGSTVNVLEIKPSVQGMLLAPVRVVVRDGHCRGTQGWVGLERLEVFRAEQQ